jgi:uncharacterized membrane protein
MKIKEEVLNMKQEVQEVKEKSLAMELLQDYKKANKRQFIIILVILTMWFATIGYLVYILNDIGTTEEVVTQDNENGYNNYIGNDGDITNGKTDN